MNDLEFMKNKAIVSDLWFAFACLNYDGSGEQLANVAFEFVGYVRTLGAVVFEGFDEEWCVLEYGRRL